MTFSSTFINEDGKIIETENKTYCSCCGIDVTDNPEGYWTSEYFKNHVTEGCVRYLALCNSCFERTFRF